MLLGVATISLPTLAIVLEFVELYPKNIELISNTGKEILGGTYEHKFHIPPPLKDLRKKKQKTC